MKVYLRKLFAHDITHEVSVTEAIIADFFDNKKDNLIFVREGKETGVQYNVCINKTTDARFGGDFKNMYKEDNVKEGDILAIKKLPDGRYSLSVIFENTPLHNQVKLIFDGKERHAISDVIVIKN